MSIPFTYILASSIMISASLFASERLPVVTATDVSRDTAAGSPSLPMQEVIDPINDFIDLSSKVYFTEGAEGDPSTDIESVNYFSLRVMLNRDLAPAMVYIMLVA